MPLPLNLDASCPAGWYECRFCRNGSEYRVVRWWSGTALYFDNRKSSVCSSPEYTDFVRLVSPAAEPEIVNGPCDIGPGVWVICYSDEPVARALIIWGHGRIEAGDQAVRVNDIPTFPPPAPVMPAGPKPEVCAWRHRPSGKVLWGIRQGDYVIDLDTDLEDNELLLRDCERVPEVSQ